MFSRALLIPALVIAACYGGFGLAAFVWTHYHPHFIGFMVIGAIVAVAASRPGKPSSNQND